MDDIFSLMSRMKGHDTYLYMGCNEPEPQRSGSSESMFFHCAGRRTTLSTEDCDSLSYLASSIHHSLDRDRILLSWDLKDLISFVLERTGILMELPSSVYDLRLISSYFSMQVGRPVKFRESVEFLKRAMSMPKWDVFHKFYVSVYVPLITRVLPEIENCCLVDNKRAMCVYPHYVPEGQSNGRMKALAPTDRHYNPHSIGPDLKGSLRPPGYDESFVCFDFRNMEVNVLQWLSGDVSLKSALESGDDPYRAIWSMIAKGEAKDSQRQICKDVFLPVVFGQGPASLAANVGMEEKNASKLIDTFVKTFPVAFDWVRSQSADGDNTATDFFGRRRIFKSHELYKIRNFSVQSPASMICLRKLVRLRESLSGRARVCFHVHDGYYLVCAKNDVDFVCEMGTSVLEEEDDLFPGLSLKTSCHFGNRLDELKPKERGQRL